MTERGVGEEQVDACKRGQVSSSVEAFAKMGSAANTATLVKKNKKTPSPSFRRSQGNVRKFSISREKSKACNTGEGEENKVKKRMEGGLESVEVATKNQKKGKFPFSSPPVDKR